MPTTRPTAENRNVKALKKVSTPTVSTKKNGEASKRKTPEKPGTDKDRLVLSEAALEKKAVPIFAETPSAALELALKGEPVFSPNGNGMGLALAVQASKDEKVERYDVSLDGSRVEITAPAGENAADAMKQSFQLYATVPLQLRGKIKSIFADKDSFSVVFSSAEGKEQKAVISKTDKNGYRISLDDVSFQLNATQDGDLGEALSLSINCFSQVPDHLKGAVKTISLESGANPTDEYWGKLYHIENFISAATGANGNITFYHGTDNFEGNTLNHEFGHNIGQLYSTKNNLIPDDWEEAVKADGQVVSEYAKASPAEAFAEAWATYLAPKTDRNEFRQKYPNQAKILEAIYNGERKPITTLSPKEA